MIQRTENIFFIIPVCSLLLPFMNVSVFQSKDPVFSNPVGGTVVRQECIKYVQY